MVRARLKELSIEEAANSLTHGFGLLLSIAGFVFLLADAIAYGDGWHLASSVIYGLSLVTLYAASTVYHGAVCPIKKSRLQLVDHACIYLLIAGSYTPFALVLLRDGIGPALFVFAWVFAIVGIVTKIVFDIRSGFVSALIYLVMGWVGVVAIEPMYAAAGVMPLILAVLGGLSYTVGVVFFGWTKIRHHHAIWHVFVLTGSVLHFLAIAIYVMPYRIPTV